MDRDQWEKISGIFHSALELEPVDRTAFLKRVCDGDETLREEVESLLRAHAEAANFIDTPVAPLNDLYPDNAPSLTGTYFGEYLIEKTIGRGGMGEVYLARDPRLDRLVALKKLPDRFIHDHNFLRRFQIEAKAAATLNHPNVATIYSVEEHRGRPFITMEYVEGKTLDALLPAGGLKIEAFLDCFIKLSDGLRHAHEKGVVHRDIKPGNIMISTDGTPKILDFGLAETVTEQFEFVSSRPGITPVGQVIGTPSYMSPEQAKGQEVDHRGDIFSFGVVMFEAITGVRPFVGESNADVLSNVLRTDPPLVSEIRPETPLPIARLIDRCLEKRRRGRPQSMKEVRSKLVEARDRLGGGVSTSSLGHRLYRETVSRGSAWRLAAIPLIILLSILGWYYFSQSSSAPFPSFENMAMKRLSQSSNIAYASISPDGKFVAYVTMEESDGRALWLRHVNDNSSLQLLPPQPVQFWDNPVISADGQVYFITASPSATHGTLYRISALGGQPRKLIDTVNHLGSLSPDGQRLLFVRYGDSNQIFTVNAADGSGQQPILSAYGDTLFMQPRFSSDGRSVYYVKRELVGGFEYWSVMMVPASGGRESEILRQRDRIGELAVLPDSNGLLINANDPVSNVHQLYHIALPDGKKTRVTNDLNFYFGLSVDDSGRNIVSVQRNDENRVWVGDAADPWTVKPILKGPNVGHSIDWTPDGRIVFDAYEDNRTHIWISDPIGKNAQQLTGSDFDDAEPQVSGDGRYIVFTSNRSGFNQIWRMNVDGGDQVLLADVDGFTERPRFAADGQTVVFNWIHGRARTLAQVPLSGGHVEGLLEMPSTCGYYWAASPDGKSVAYTVRDEAKGRCKVAVRSVDSIEPEAILDISPTWVCKWMPDSRGLYYRQRGDEEGLSSKVLQIDIAGRKSKVLLSTEPETVFDMSYSRDRKKVAVVRGRINSDAVILTSASKN